MNPKTNKKPTRMWTRQTKLPDIPDVIIHEILAYLPVKSLCRFRCVSKPWQALIADPGFVTKHTDKAEQKDEVRSRRRRLMFADKKHKSFLSFPIDEYYLNGEGEFEKLDFQHGGGDAIQVFLLSCCNSLVLYKLYVGENSPELYIGNPATRQCRQLPMPYDQLAMEDEHDEEQPFGFGFVSSIDDYKVVTLCSSGEAKGYSIQFSVFTLGTGFWEVSGVGLDYKLQSCWDGILLNGSLHWFVGKLDEEDNVVEEEDDVVEGGGDGCVIICFDLETEVVREISVPSDQFFQAESYHMALYQGRLCITHNDLRNDDNEFWLMREYGVQESWTKIVISGVLPDRNYVPTCYQDKQTGDDLWICDGQFVTCNLDDDDEVNIISRFPWISSQRHVSCQVGFYVESLYSLDYVPMIQE